MLWGNAHIKLNLIIFNIYIYSIQKHKQQYILYILDYTEYYKCMYIKLQTVLTIEYYKHIH